MSTQHAPTQPSTTEKKTVRRPRIGVIGGGQLARMMIPVAIELDLELHVLATSPDESAARVSPHVMLGHHDDPEAVTAFARSVDVVTFDHEHVPTGLLHALEHEGVAVRPGPEALVYAQDKLAMRARLTELGHPCPAWWRVETEADLETALRKSGGDLILKTARGGYDGHGVRRVRAIEDARDWLKRGEPLLAEERVPFVRELSAQVARRPGGEIASYPVTESEQKDGVCFRVSAPAPGLSVEASTRARDLAAKIANDLGVVGMLAVELFEYPDGRIAVNELAMRPHNTGHWSMDGCVTSQFEQHLRAVADLPLGDTTPTSPWTVMVNTLGDTRENLAEGAREALAHDAAIKVHLYGKSVRQGRKLGHVTALGTDLEQTERRARAAAHTIVTGDESKE
ncbi:5-(carboxyamino)imidazole ribonucleotide synthase [Dermabacter sp. HSID17554]|uniref:5-(carboxyamino)imidazole ribonucleotide synthase n=1 Tax=Dermabacter sp. HSID17554 TaxID=2419511 RepID=UPI0015768321|nr:5-(carboxyamino)imidazole ribonucleotide synthase [Dermabacter sp. HSID17554]